MTIYLSNLLSWLTGFRRVWRAEAIDYKPGWNRWNFLPLYLIDYGLCVIVLAGPVTSISQYAEAHWFSSYHGAHAGPPLWGTVRSPPWVRAGVPFLWASILWFLI